MSSVLSIRSISESDMLAYLEVQVANPKSYDPETQRSKRQHVSLYYYTSYYTRMKLRIQSPMMPLPTGLIAEGWRVGF